MNLFCNQRARTEEDKAQRRSIILEAAEQVFSDSPEKLPSVIEIARQAKLGKGTVYLYFKTKEEIFLTILQEGYDRWFQAMEESLRPSQTPTPEELAERIIAPVVNQKVFLSLCGMTLTVLETNLTRETIYDFKTNLGRNVTKLAVTLSKTLEIKEDKAIALILEVYTAVAGAWQTSQRPSVLLPIKKDFPYKFLFTDFKTSATQIVTHVIRGSTSQPL